SGGVLELFNGNALGGGGLSMADGTTLLDGAGTLTVGNGITLNGTDAVDKQGGDLTLSGLIHGTGVLWLSDTGGGFVTVTHANTYSGGTTLDGGVLIVGDDAALGTGALSMADGTTLKTSSSGSLGNTITLVGSDTVDSN